MLLIVLLQVLFIGLKLTGFIAWSWGAVLSPVLVVVSVSVFLCILALIAGLSRVFVR